MSLVHAIIEKVHAVRQHHANKAEYRAMLMEAVSDGKLTADEIHHLQQARESLGLTIDEVAALRVGAYLAAFSAAKAVGDISAEEEKELQSIRTFLGILNSDVTATVGELAHLRLLHEIHQGNVPAVNVPGVILKKGEIAFWHEAARILEERVVSRQYVGGSQGMSFRIARGVSYRVGAQRGHIESRSGIVPVSMGELVITSKRLIFVGNEKGFNISLDKILNLELHADGLTVTDSASKPHLVQFTQDGNADVVGAILTHAVNHFSA